MQCIDICHVCSQSNAYQWVYKEGEVQWIRAMPCKPGVAGSIPGFCRTTFDEPLGAPVIKYTHKP